MSDVPIDTTRPVLVTGATGYVAGWIIRRLLEEGVTVHATVRDPSDTAKVGHLVEMGASLPGGIKLFKADLLQPGSFDEAMKGCAIVMHTASPYKLNVDDPQRDLVDPALNGTRNVLEAVSRTETVTRVVLTSSCAAIYGDTADCDDAPGGILTEDVWNTTSSVDHIPYSYSKTAAERAAWDVAEAQDRWRLVVMNPAGIYGPSVGGPIPTSESFNLVRQIAGGEFKSGAPHLETGKVDVRDVAEAHLRGAFLPDAEGRHILAEKAGTILEMGAAISAAYPDAPVPRRTMPKWLIWLIGPMVNKALTRKTVTRTIGHHWRADNSKARNPLGLTFPKTDKDLVEMYEQKRESWPLAK